MFEEEGPGVKEDAVLLVDLRRAGQWREWGTLEVFGGGTCVVSSTVRSASRQQPTRGSD